MAVGQLSLGIPGSGATDFATAPIPPIVLSQWPKDTTPTRQEFNYATMAGRSAYGTPRIEGPAYDITYGWTIPAWLTLPLAIQLGSLAKWQDRFYKTSGGDGKLRLIDEIRVLDAEPPPHSRPLLTSFDASTLNPAWTSGYVYGYGVFNCKIELPNDWDSFVGSLNSVQRRVATFTLVEV